MLCYAIPEGIHGSDDEIEGLLYKMGIPDYLDPTLYYRGGMTATGGGWMAEFESNVPEGEEAKVYRRIISIQSEIQFTISGLIESFWIMKLQKISVFV